MLGTGYSLCFLKIAKINSQQEKPICPNRKNLVPQNTKSSLRSADAFPVVTSPLREVIFRRERSDDRKYVCASQATQKVANPQK